MTPTTDINNEDRIISFLIDRRYRVYRHLVFLTVIASVMYSSVTINPTPLDIHRKMFFSGFFVFIFYTNMYIFMPFCLFKKRYVSYFLAVLFYIFVDYGIVLFLNNILAPRYENFDRYFNPKIDFKPTIFIILIFIAASSAVKLFQRWIKDAQRINELEKTTIRSELEQLKTQINPHFLFNMLNNANVLTQKDPEKASQVLMKLSDLLRYQLYDSTRNKVLLTADIHFLTDFLNLEKIRRDNFEFIVSKEGEISGLLISPLLFIPFVENAVKHSLDADNKSYVHAFFEVKNDMLYFECVNSKPEVVMAKKDVGGLGLVNVKRRLALLYPQSHQLQITDDQDKHTVRLNIKI